MFVEHKEATEITEAPSKLLKPSDAMRLGCKLTPAGHLYYDGVGRTCAVCAAAVGAGYTRKMHTGGSEPVYRYLKEAFPNVPLKIWDKAEDIYMTRTKTREEVADWLESKGY